MNVEDYGYWIRFIDMPNFKESEAYNLLSLSKREFLILYLQYKGFYNLTYNGKHCMIFSGPNAKELLIYKKIATRAEKILSGYV